MPCSTFINVACDIKSVIGGVASGFLSELASGVQDALSWLLTNSVSYWVRLPSPDLTQEPAITAMQQWLLPISAAVAVGGMIAAGIRMCLTRRANPILDVGTGLITIAATAALGVTVPNLLLQAGDAWSNWVLQASTGGELGTRMDLLFTFGGSVPSAIVIVFGIFAMIMSAFQAVFLMFRQAAIVILAAVLPLAAAGSFAPLTRAWMRKITSWMLALIAYKPAAAAVYAAAFTMIGKGQDMATVMMAFAMLALSLLAMPVLMRFFNWTTGAMASGGGGQLLGMGAAGAMALGAMRSTPDGAGRSSAGQHASYLSSQQPQSSSQSAPQGSEPASPSAPAPGGTSSAGGAGSAGGAATSGAASSAPASSSNAAASAARAAGVAAAAVTAAQALATGARSAAGKTTEEGGR